MTSPRKCPSIAVFEEKASAHVTTFLWLPGYLQTRSTCLAESIHCWRKLAQIEECRDWHDDTLTTIMTVTEQKVKKTGNTPSCEWSCRWLIPTATVCLSNSWLPPTATNRTHTHITLLFRHKITKHFIASRKSSTRNHSESTNFNI